MGRESLFRKIMPDINGQKVTDVAKALGRSVQNVKNSLRIVGEGTVTIDPLGRIVVNEERWNQLPVNRSRSTPPSSERPNILSAHESKKSVHHSQADRPPRNLSHSLFSDYIHHYGDKKPLDHMRDMTEGNPYSRLPGHLSRPKTRR